MYLINNYLEVKTILSTMCQAVFVLFGGWGGGGGINGFSNYLKAKLPNVN